MRLITLPGVFKPHSDSWALADLLGEYVNPGDSVLDLCTGSGVLAVAAALAGAGDVTAVDVSRRAAVTAWLNGRLNGVRVQPLRGDLFAAAGSRRFDLVVSNPPYIPAPDNELPRRGLARAWDAGHDGRALLDRICADAPRHLRPGGSLLLVHSSVCGEQRTLRAMTAAGLEPAVVMRQRGRLGRLLTRRRRMLVERGLIEAGAAEEELLYIRAVAPVVPAAAGPGRDGATIAPYRDGPYLVSGAFTIRDQEGNTIDPGRRTVALCRCGHSKQRPFCDGTHKVIGFTAASGPLRAGDRRTDDDAQEPAGVDARPAGAMLASAASAARNGADAAAHNSADAARNGADAAVRNGALGNGLGSRARWRREDGSSRDPGD